MPKYWFSYVLLLGCIVPLLVACTAAPTYNEVQATAQLRGCWPDQYPTPRALTITPAEPLAMATGTLTPLPSTTPYPRCPAAPGETPIVWPTAVPNPPAYPTMEPRRWVGGSHRQSVLSLPNTVLSIDMATHPTEGWPAVASVVWSGNSDPDRIFVNVYHPETGRWSLAHQVDLGQSRVGRYSRNVAVAITPDRTVHAVWGMSDPDFTDNDPPPGIWTAYSTDFGTTWSQPERIATNCRAVNDLASAPDGSVVALLICDAGRSVGIPTLVVRNAAGEWQAPQRTNASVWLYSEGALLITGSAAEATITAVVFAGNGSPTGYLIQRSLANGSTRLRSFRVSRPDGLPTGVRMWHVRGLSTERRLSDGTMSPLLWFSWTDAEAGSAYTIRSLDGGQSWGAPELVADATQGQQITFAAPAYDPAADRMVTLWNCCHDDIWEEFDTTQYASWSVPSESRWYVVDAPDQPKKPIPLALGGRSVANSITAQAANMRMTWLAWIERRRTIVVRTVDLNQLIPIDHYPIPTATAGGGS